MLAYRFITNVFLLITDRICQFGNIVGNVDRKTQDTANHFTLNIFSTSGMDENRASLEIF